MSGNHEQWAIMNNNTIMASRPAIVGAAALIVIVALLTQSMPQPREYCVNIARAALSVFHRKGRPLSLPSQGDLPQQVHVSLAGENQTRVSWITARHSSASSRVEYGESPGIYDRFSDGHNDSYTFGRLYKSGQIHNAVIGPLEPATIYYYRCGGGGPEYSFKTPPGAGSQTPVTFAIVGDLGQTEWTSSTLAHIKNSSYDVLILPGDLSYADCCQPRWDSFGMLVEPLASSRPWMVTQGNHEVEHIRNVTDSFMAYNARWKMPFNESGSDSNLYYSFNVAGVHVLMLGSYANISEGSNQSKWLQHDLAKVDRGRTPWLIAVIHAPWYNSNKRHRGEGEDMRKSMEPLLQEAKVDLIFAGHVHAYERTERVFNGTANDSGFVHITIGDGGNHEGLAPNFTTTKPTWSACRNASFGYGRLEVVNATHARWSWHRNDDVETVEGDKIWIQSWSDSSF